MLIQVIGIVTHEELTAITNESFVLVEQTENRVHAIVDQSALESMPKSLKSLSDSFPRNSRANQGITVLVIPDMNRFGKFIGSVLMQLVGLEYRIVNTMEEAEFLLQSIKRA
jgi:hypothetical protein